MVWLQPLSRFLATASLSRNLCIAVGSITPDWDTCSTLGLRDSHAWSLPVFPSHLCFSEPTCRPLILCCGFKPARQPATTVLNLMLKPQASLGRSRVWKDGDSWAGAEKADAPRNKRLFHVCPRGLCWRPTIGPGDPRGR